MNLENLVKKANCRKGKIDGTTKNGRFWLVDDSITIRETNNGRDPFEISFSLYLRHFEDDHVEAVVIENKENMNINRPYINVYPKPSLLLCEIVEDVVVELKKGIQYSAYDKDGRVRDFILECYDDCFYKDLSNYLIILGMIESRPGPDEIDSM